MNYLLNYSYQKYIKDLISLFKLKLKLKSNTKYFSY